MGTRRSSITRTLAAALTSIALAGCGSFYRSIPTARVHHGPAYAKRLRRFAAPPVECFADGREWRYGTSESLCDPQMIRAVTVITRMSMELAGATVVDSELLNAEVRRQRGKSPDEHPASPGVTVEGEGSIHADEAGVTAHGKITVFVDLPPPERRALLVSMGVEGTLGAELRIGAADGFARTVTVIVNARHVEDGELAWRSACSIESGGDRSLETAVEHAARCAMEATSLW